MDLHDLERRMKELDQIVFDHHPNMHLECVIVGGGALLIKKATSRSTLDIDVLYASKIVEDYFDIFDFNSKVKSLSFCFPYNYEDRLELVDIETKVIRYYTPSIEDLIISKLYAFREKDQEDLKAIIHQKQYDIHQLDKVVEEARLSALNDRMYNEMVSLYNRLFKE
ncbi:MAG: DUF6036 family nucleotidyltransferase [Candidatus Izemoplasmatales bacterium]